MKGQILIEHLLPEEANIVTEVINEAAGNVKGTWLKGIFMQAEIKNRNGRRYPLSEMASAVASFNEAIKEGNGVCGEINHPVDSLNIDYKNVSHVIKEAYMDGNNVMCRALLLDTPCGLIAKEIYKAGVKPAVSSRGAGNVLPDGIVEGFHLVTVDIVALPSAYGARPNLINESILNTKQGNKLLNLAEALQHDKSAQKYFKKSVDAFLKDLFN